MEEKFDFSGYATKNDVLCADGKIIRQDAFKDNHGKKVPLVWNHGHDSAENVLGHAILENRKDGVYAYGKFNDTDAGIAAKKSVKNGDIDALSIFANRLKQKGSEVLHGAIREVSLVLAGANKEAFIDTINIEHSEDGEDAATIYMFQPISTEEVVLEHAEDDSEDADSDETVADVVNSMNEKQKQVLYALVGQAAEGNTAEQSDEDGEVLEHADDEGGTVVKNNVFDQDTQEKSAKISLTHDEMKAVFVDAQKCGSFKDAVLKHADDYGIKNIDILFPDAKLVNNTPEMITRNMDWVQGVLSGTRHTPFSRIKSTAADITEDEARAKGYITGNRKKEEVFPVMKRITTPQTIYKKQKLDRDDILDITDFDVVSWMRAEMRVMLNEEIARAVLIGDGRDITSDDKINENNIRPIYTDDELYSRHITLTADRKTNDFVEEVMRSRKYYKGSGNPTLYTTVDVVTDMLLVKDSTGRRLYPTQAELMAALRVSNIVEVEVMENITREVGSDTLELQGILVNLNDYVIGADKGGEINSFDDFDIDYNQYKYLLETRISGALVKPHSAIVFEKVQAAG